MKTMAVNITADIMSEGQTVFEEEYDLELAEAAILGNLKVIEALLKASPENRQLLVILAKSYGGYSFAFLEDRYEALREKNPRRSNQYKKRASDFYMRGKAFAMRHLFNENDSFEAALKADIETYEEALQDFDEDEVDTLFWAAYNWGNWINMNLHSPAAIAGAPKMELMMKRVLELDEKYYFGGPHLFYGVYLAARPPMLGGNTKKAKEHFEKVLELSDRKFLIAQVLYARFYAVGIQNERLFTKLLREVVRADDKIFPEQSMITQIAKKKARRLLTEREDFF